MPIVTLHTSLPHPSAPDPTNTMYRLLQAVQVDIASVMGPPNAADDIKWPAACAGMCPGVSTTGATAAAVVSPAARTRTSYTTGAGLPHLNQHPVIIRADESDDIIHPTPLLPVSRLAAPNPETVVQAAVKAVDIAIEVAMTPWAKAQETPGQMTLTTLLQV